ncbi:MAG TPA: hypothetical protein VGN01_05055 [Acidobacteriaceae bacterium]|jgi:hypothetical protein
MDTVQEIEPEVADAMRSEKESKRMFDLEKVADMSLESLLYYVLAGEGRKENTPARR